MVTSSATTFSEDGYWADYDADKTRSVNSVRGWCNYQPPTGPEDAFDMWVGQRCPGACCVGPYNEKDHTSQQSIIVAVNGSCRQTEKELVQFMGFGIYFGQENPNNDSFYIEFVDQQPVQPATQRAEISAAVAALQKICDVQLAVCKHKIDRHDGGDSPPVKGLSDPLLRVIIKSDSDYLVKSMTDWLEKRRQTKYLTSGGKPITNKDVLESLDDWTTLLERAHVHVVFWHVPKEQNVEAEELADEALDRAS